MALAPAGQRSLVQNRFSFRGDLAHPKTNRAIAKTGFFWRSVMKLSPRIAKDRFSKALSLAAGSQTRSSGGVSLVLRSPGAGTKAWSRESGAESGSASQCNNVDRVISVVQISSVSCVMRSGRESRGHETAFMGRASFLPASGIVTIRAFPN